MGSRGILAVVWAACFLTNAPAIAQSAGAPGAQPTVAAPRIFLGQTEGDFVVKDYRFRDGELLPELRLHYTTLGQQHRNAAGVIDNAVLLLHATGDDGTEFFDPKFSDVLFGAGEPLDLAKFYVVLPDAIGHGKSSKPSDGLRAHFPRYDYEDMVAAQHLLVTQKLGLSHFVLVLGASMGGMHAWLWGERYPDMMDALAPISALPAEIGGRNRLWRRMVTEAIRHDPEWKGGDYVQEPHEYSRIGPLIMMMVSSPVALYDKYPTEAAADAFYDQIVQRAHTYDVNDRLYQYDASRDYDPAPDLDRITAGLLAIFFADDQINSPEFGALDRQMPRVKHGRYLIVPISAGSNGEGNNLDAKRWRNALDALLAAPTAVR